jgi:hypothetical protein
MEVIVGALMDPSQMRSRLSLLVVRVAEPSLDHVRAGQLGLTVRIDVAHSFKIARKGRRAEGQKPEGNIS